MSINIYNKYIKYKQKYIILNNLYGGGVKEKGEEGEENILTKLNDKFNIYGITNEQVL